MNLNKVIIIGRLTADPQLRTIPSGQQVASFSIATNRIWTDKMGKKQDETEFHNVVVWGRQAEIASQFLFKGSMAMIEGRLRTRTWQNKEGHNIKTTEIISERLQLGPRSQNSGGFSKQAPSLSHGIDQDIKEELPEINIDEEGIKADDLPF
ncbi:single-stranded DNA-binding protein [Candidatus Wolfebacteria bacterium CG10_big_fil_rev_8_21_14_0_10_31_9]|uniref:Single-stranded DNA-binding protein n=1 Tax=Candidatus Wolfebacteria bacterium CG10_big_fil_rev_8_21_14_0_10_31_9 TaxID=1975070 RepID=A0A2H0RC21_9BACT|nr:MAG: single-stranded DNA-binding protein [Candidatus Wolfebacteria bacterium CG10_big_fil_rev_8_21_14_0_10_31_9]